MPIVVLVAAIVVVVGAGVAFALTRGGAGPSHPKNWDARVTDLVSFVEKTRGHDFEHPIKIEFLPVAEFRKRVTARDELTDEDREEIEQVTGVVRALGLAEGKLDLLAAFEQLQGETVIGLYSFETVRILVRGDKVLPTMRPTLVHELTHAMQDQLFDLDHDTKTSGEDLAYSALVESDALRIENEYVDSLSQAEQDAIDADQDEQSDEADLKGVPEFLTELFATPYVLGPPWLATAIGTDGNAGADAAFRRPPVSEEEIVSAAAYINDDRPQKVATPRLRSGEKSLDDGDFGMLSMLLVLGERLPYPQARAAVDGWEGDAEVTFRSHDRTCIRVHVLTETTKDRDELTAAFESWGQGSDLVDVATDGPLATLSSCDPGVDAKRPAATGPRAFEIISIEATIVSGMQQGGVKPDVAQCAVDHLVTIIGAQGLHDLNQIEDPNDPRVPQLQQTLIQQVAACQQSG